MSQPPPLPIPMPVPVPVATPVSFAPAAPRLPSPSLAVPLPVAPSVPPSTATQQPPLPLSPVPPLSPTVGVTPGSGWPPKPLTASSAPTPVPVPIVPPLQPSGASPSSGAVVGSAAGHQTSAGGRVGGPSPIAQPEGVVPRHSVAAVQPSQPVALAVASAVLPPPPAAVAIPVPQPAPVSAPASQPVQPISAHSAAPAGLSSPHVAASHPPPATLLGLSSPFLVMPASALTASAPPSQQSRPPLPAPPQGTGASTASGPLTQPPQPAPTPTPPSECPPPPPPREQPPAHDEGAAREQQQQQQPVPPSEALPAVDYSAYVFRRGPTASTLSDAVKVPTVGFAASSPDVVARVCDVAVDTAAAMRAVPRPLPPSTVVFGGAKYDCGAFVKNPHPPPKPEAAGLRREHQDPTGEWSRLQFMIDQLTLAKNYLKLESERVSRATSSSSASTTLSAPQRRSGAPPSMGDIGEAEAVDFARTNIWTVAYGGSPRQVQAFLDRVKGTDALHGVGYVNLRHRQWGIKKSSEEYQLGLGRKGTPLQFAAVAKRLDNVLVLLANGARDNMEPRLEALLTREALELIRNVMKPPRKVPSRPSPPSANPSAAPPREEDANRHTEAEAAGTALPMSPDLSLMPPSQTTPVFAPPSMPQFTSLSVKPVVFTF